MGNCIGGSDNAVTIATINNNKDDEPVKSGTVSPGDTTTTTVDNPADHASDSKSNDFRNFVGNVFKNPRDTVDVIRQKRHKRKPSPHERYAAQYLLQPNDPNNANNANSSNNDAMDTVTAPVSGVAPVAPVAPVTGAKPGQLSGQSSYEKYTAQINELKTELARLKVNNDHNADRVTVMNGILSDKIESFRAMDEKKWEELEENSKKSKMDRLKDAGNKLTANRANIQSGIALIGNSNDPAAQMGGVFQIVASVGDIMSVAGPLAPIGTGISVFASIGSIVMSIISTTNGSKKPDPMTEMFNSLLKNIQSMIDTAVNTITAASKEVEMNTYKTNLVTINNDIDRINGLLEQLVDDGDGSVKKTLKDDIDHFIDKDLGIGSLLTQTQSYICSIFQLGSSGTQPSGGVNPLRAYTGLVQQYISVLNKCVCYFNTLVSNASDIYSDDGDAVITEKINSFNTQTQLLTTKITQLFSNDATKGIGIAINPATGQPYDLAMYLVIRIYDMLIRADNYTEGQSKVLYTDGIIEEAMYNCKDKNNKCKAVYPTRWPKWLESCRYFQHSLRTKWSEDGDEKEYYYLGIGELAKDTKSQYLYDETTLDQWLGASSASSVVHNCYVCPNILRANDNHAIYEINVTPGGTCWYMGTDATNNYNGVLQCHTDDAYGAGTFYGMFMVFVPFDANNPHKYIVSVHKPWGNLYGGFDYYGNVSDTNILDGQKYIFVKSPKIDNMLTIGKDFTAYAWEVVYNSKYNV